MWVVNPHPKPRQVRPGTVLGIAEYVEPDEVTVVNENMSEMKTVASSEDASPPHAVSVCLTSDAE